MTIYYIRPELGSNTNTGLSWAAAWSSLYALRLKSISLLPGDLVKIEKSETKGFNGPTVWQLHSALDNEGNNTGAIGVTPAYVLRRPLGGTGTTWVSGTTLSTFTSLPGGATLADANNLNATGTKLCYKTSDAGGVDLSPFQSILFTVKMSTAYTGTGEQNIPPGVFEIRFCSDTLGDTPILTVPINMWIKNSTTGYSSVYYDNVNPLPTGVNSVAICRSSVVLSRSSVLWGVTFYRCTMYTGWSSITPWGKNILVKKQATAHSVPGSFYGRNAPMDLGWLNNNSVMECNTVNTTYSEPGNYTNSSISNVSISSHSIGKCYVVGGIHMVGTTKWNAGVGSQIAAFDLNGSVGGTLASPIVIEGGYDVSTDLVTGETLYSGGFDFNGIAHFLDLQSAPYITVKNITAVYGFHGIVANPGTGLYLERVQFSHSPVNTAGIFGATINTNITLKYCTGSSDLGLNLGVVGDLTILSCLFTTSIPPYGGYVECGELVIDSSGIIVGNSHSFYISVRGNALVTNFLFNGSVWPPIRQITSYGKVFTCRNHMTATVANTPFSTPKTSIDSRWYQVRFENCSLDNMSATWSAAEQPSCDEEVHWINCTATANIAAYGPTTSVSTMSTSAHYKKTEYTVGNYQMPIPVCAFLVEIHDPAFSALDASPYAFVLKHLSVYSMYSGAVSIACVSKSRYIYPRQVSPSYVTSSYVDGEAARDPANVTGTKHTAWWPWHNPYYSFVPYPTGITPLPLGVTKKFSDVVIYSQGGQNKLGGFPALPLITTHVGPFLADAQGPMLNFMLSAGVPYKIKLSVLPGLALSGEDDVSSAKPIKVAVGNNPVFQLTVCVLSTGTLSPTNKLFVYTISGTPTLTTWIDLEYDLLPVQTGEVSVLVGRTRQTDGYLMDGLRIEAV